MINNNNTKILKGKEYLRNIIIRMNYEYKIKDSFYIQFIYMSLFIYFLKLKILT